MTRRSLLALALVTPALAACAGRGARAPVDANAPTILEVKNDYIGPITLYAVTDGGFAMRVGTVTSSKVERFRLSPTIVGGARSVRIIAVPLADNGRASTGALSLSPGQTVRFNVATDLRASTTFISDAQ